MDCAQFGIELAVFSGRNADRRLQDAGMVGLRVPELSVEVSIPRLKRLLIIFPRTIVLSCVDGAPGMLHKGWSIRACMSCCMPDVLARNKNLVFSVIPLVFFARLILQSPFPLTLQPILY
jgi:hypothetical protein